MNNYVIDYDNENYYKKLERSLRKYNIVAYKKLMFDFYPSFKEGKFLGDIILKKGENNIIKYELKLPTDDLFQKIHGNFKLIYTVYKDKKIVMLNSLDPKEILMDGHKSELTSYKGVMISKTNAQKDMFKINLLNMLNDDK